MFALSRIVGLGALAALAAAALMLGSPAARGQAVSCGERQTVIEQLGQRFQEKRSAFGITADGRLIEVMVGPGGSWTILLTRPGGPTCLVSSGEGWKQLVAPPDGPLA